MLPSCVDNYVSLLFMVGLSPLAARAQAAAENDPAGLAQLHDIVMPDRVDLWWPPAPGWYVLVVLCVVVAAVFAWRIRQRWQAARYRTEALAELRTLRHETSQPQAAAAALLILLKRTALAAYPRTQVASLNGAAWWTFLDLSGGRPLFSAGLGDLAERIVYAQQDGDAISARDMRRLYKAAGQWIKRHHPADSLPVPDRGSSADSTRQVEG